ncbi:MAG: exosome complex RNA-binding protein Csl4 [Thaumarchaeota archaeon]|nr:exosome complex RNA-binding protein Csl4 [Candidatus Calditenuaceae archaeon]MDW8186773.1 exosome complex RNA-binding protein Csl4 [Nitrososphaerota archaeon]
MAFEKRLVLPGERVGVIEEFIFKEGLWANRRGEIIAKKVGTVNYELRRHEVALRPLKRDARPKTGDIVLAAVRELQDRVMWCDILGVAGIKKALRYSGAILRTSKLLDFNVGDLVLAKVVDDTFGTYTLSVEGKELGLVLGFCDFCGRTLADRVNVLHCNSCRRTFRKKVSIQYRNFGKLLFMFPVETMTQVT